MPRPKYEATKAEHVDPEKLGARKAKRIRRARGKGLLKPRVVAGTAAARALGIK